MDRNELRRLQKAAKDKDIRKLGEWASQFENQMRQEFDRAYHDELENSINNFCTAIAYTAHFSEETRLDKDKLPSFMEDLFVTIDMFRTGEYKPEEYREELEKNGIYDDTYKYTLRTRKIITIIGLLDDFDIINSKERLLTLDGYMVFKNIIYPEAMDKILDNYKNRIRISDEVFIINKNKEIAKEIQEELNYAKSLKKLITYMEDINNG